MHCDLLVFCKVHALALLGLDEIWRYMSGEIC